jgi:hypothetical protein
MLREYQLIFERLRRAFLLVSVGLFVNTTAAAATVISVDFGESDVKQFQVLKDDYQYTRTTGNKLGRLPEIKTALTIADDGTVIPLSRGLTKTGSKYWDILFEPGRWAMNDGAVSLRLPIALVEKDANCTHQGTIVISGNIAAYQIASETCKYFQFNAQGFANITINQREDIDSDGLRERYLKETQARLTSIPIEKITSDYPMLEPTAFSQTTFIEPSSMSVYGAVVDGRHYVSDCHTRAAPYTDCNHMPLPAYSLAKSLIGGIGLMRIEALYPGVKDYPVKDLIPECNDWGDVTLEHLLNNTSGRFGSSTPHRDEDKHIFTFLAKKTAAEKTQFACNRYRQKTAPGQQWVYHTIEFWLLGVAMQNFWQQKFGGAADFYDDLLNPLWRELELSPLIRTPHRVDGQPFTGLGLMLLRTDIAKLAQAFTTENSVFDEFLDKDMFDQAMQRASNSKRLTAGNENLTYSNGFWAWNAAPALKCEKSKWIPFMSGYGGISVVFLPEGDAYYYFSDGGVFRYAEVIEHLHTHRPIC